MKPFIKLHVQILLSFAERKHRYIVKIARSLLLSFFVHSEFWGEVVPTAVSLINTITSSHNSGLSPFESYMGMSLVIPPLEFLVVLVSFFVLM